MAHANGIAHPRQTSRRSGVVGTFTHGRWLALALTIGAALIDSRAAFASPVWTNGQQRISAIIWRPGYHGFYVTGATFDNPQTCPIAGSNLYLVDPATEADPTATNRLFA